MKRIAKRLATVLCLIVCAVMIIAVPLSACGSVSTKVTYTVTYEKGDIDADVSLPDPETVTKDSTATKPEDPAADGYTFQYWYDKEDENQAEFDWDTKIERDYTLCAKWETVYTVSFDLGNVGATAIASQTIATGEKAAKPADPTATGYVFAGWYADADYATAFDFDTVITKDTTIYAKWTAEYTVTFDMGGHGTNTTAAVADGGTVSQPADPTADGYLFLGWYADADYATEFVFDTAITKDTTIYAKWTNEATITIDLTGITGISLTTDGANTYTGTINDNLFDILYNTDAFTSLYTLDTSSLETTYIITGWYIQGSENLIAEGDLLTGDITVYPSVQASNGTVTVYTVDGVTVSYGDTTISSTENSFTIPVVLGMDLETAIASADLSVSATTSEGTWTGGWEYSSDNETWTAVSSGIVIVSGMYIRPEMSYVSTITITFDSASISGVAYDGSALTSGETIEVQMGTAYSDIIEAFTITVADHYENAKVYLGTAGSTTDISEGETVSEAAVSLYIVASPKTYTLSYASTDNYMSTTLTDSEITYGQGANISFSTAASSYTNVSGYDLTGFYIAIDGVVDTSTLYTTSQSYTEAITGDITVYPVLTAPRSEGGYDDQGDSGMTLTFQDGRTGTGNSDKIQSADSEVNGVFNTTLFRLETRIGVTIQTSTTYTDDDLGNFLSTVRIKIAAGTSGSYTSGTRYNEAWTITNYNSDAVTIQLHMLNNGFNVGEYVILDSSEDITLQPNGSYTYIASGVRSTTDTSLFLLIVVKSASSTDFEFGAMCDYSIGTSLTLTVPEGVTISDTWLADYLYDYEATSSTYTIYKDSVNNYSSTVLGSEDITLPTADDLDGATGTVIWTSDGSTVTKLGSEGSATLTLESKYTITIDTTSGDASEHFTYSGESSYEIDSTANLHDFLTNTVESSISCNEGYVLNGWYYYVDDTKTTITADTTITGDVTVYPDVAEASATMYVVSNGDITITAPTSGNTVAVTAGANLLTVIETYLGNGTITYTASNGAYIASWQYSTNNTDWNDVTSETTISTGMYIRPVAGHTSTITITYNTNAVSNVQYAGTDSESGTLTIENIEQGTNFSTILKDETFAVTLKTVSGTVVFYYGDASSHENEVNLDSDTVSADVSLYIVVNFTVSYASIDDYMSTSLSTATYEYGTAVSVSIPSATDYDNQSGQELQGFYIAIDGEIDTSTSYTAGSTYSVTSITGNIEVYPLLADANTLSMTWTLDHYIGSSGTETTNHSYPTTTYYNANVFRYERRLTTDAVNNIRVSPPYAVTSGTTYSSTIIFTNHNSDSLTFTASIAKSGYYGDNGTYDPYITTDSAITLEAGESYIWTFTYDCSKDDSHPMLCIYSASAAYTMGLIWDFSSTTTDATD